MSKCVKCGNEILTGDIHWEMGLCNNCYNELYKDHKTHISLDKMWLKLAQDFRDENEKLQDKVADLEAKLAESEKQIKDAREAGNMAVDSWCKNRRKYGAQIAEMQNKSFILYSMLYETLEKQGYDNVASQIDQMTGWTYDKEADWLKGNRNYDQLKQQLAECEKKAYSRGHSQRDIANEIKLNALREDVAYKEKRIVELKQQLAESEKSKELYRLQNEQHHLQLLQFYSRLGVEAFGADIHEKALETLMIMKERLAEKEKENTKLKEVVDCVDKLKQFNVDMKDYALVNRDVADEIYCEHQDKISFCIEQLEKVKSAFGLINSKLDKVETIKEYIHYIDHQINELKETK